MKKVFIIGGGMGQDGLLTKEASNLLLSCDEVYAFDRLTSIFTCLRKDIIKCAYTNLAKFIDQSKAETIGILVSGDVGFFSIAKTLINELNSRYEVHAVCGISSLQYLCSKLKISYENINVISLHGRDKSILGSLAYHQFTFVLTGGSHNAADILKSLVETGLGDIRVTSGEMLSMPDERILSGTIKELAANSFDSLTVLLFENPDFVQKEKPLFDEDFIRDSTPMTKQEIRWVSASYLKIEPDDIIYDIGAGTGSVSVEMARKAYNGVVYAFEKEKDAFDLLNRNRNKLGAFNVRTILGNAAEEIKKLPVPDKVFIGGSNGKLPEMISYLHSVNPNIIFVINAITVETLSEAVSALKSVDYKMQIACLNCAKNRSIGEYNLMTANNPVYIIAGENHAG